MLDKKFILYALHGFLGKPKDWQFLSNPCIAVDLFDYSNFSFQSWANSFNASVRLQNLGAKVLMGYSLGGRLALHALIQDPTLWDAAIIISAHSGLKDQNERVRRVAQDEAWAQRFEKEPWDHLMQDWNAQKVFQNDQVKIPRHEAEFSRKTLAQALRSWSLGIQQDLQFHIEQFPVPILWIAGELDSFYAERASLLKLSHASSQVWIANQTGHRVPWEQPIFFQAKVNEFLNLQ